MKKIIALSALATIAVCSQPVLAADVGVSININQPGLYGRIDLGNVAPPPVIYTRPVVIEQVPVGVVAPAPIYLHVPPGHEKHWEKHCREYNACGHPVYFVKEDWYAREYAPRHREDEHGRRHDRDDDDRDHDHDHRHGHGHGHDHDRD
jgi:hypothetical protein